MINGLPKEKLLPIKLKLQEKHLLLVKKLKLNHNPPKQLILKVKKYKLLKKLRLQRKSKLQRKLKPQRKLKLKNINNEKD
jgi:hypothetical protein